MNSEQRSALSKDLINLQDQYLKSMKRDTRRSKNGYYGEVKNRGGRPLTGGGKIMYRYFTLESVFLLVCLTVSLLVLPVVLPPLPPPPLLLLLLPILILAVLMLLAFMPSGVREITHAYA